VCEAGREFLVVAVQLQDEEDKEEEKGTHLSCDGKRLLLVQAREAQLRNDAPSNALALEVTDKNIMKKFFQVEDVDLSYTSASDDHVASKDARIRALEEEVRRLKVEPQSRPEEPEEDGSFADAAEELDEDLQDEPLIQLLQKRRQKVGAAPTPPAKPERKTGVGGLLKREKEKDGNQPAKMNAKWLEEEKGGGDGEDMLTALLRGGQTLDNQTMQNLINVEMLKLLSNRRKLPMGKGSGEGDGESASDEETGPKPKGAAKAIRDYHSHRHQIFRAPVKNVRLYLEECREELGIDPGESFRMLDMTKKIGFSDEHRNLHRFDWMMRNVLKMLLEDRADEAALQAVLCLRTIRQVKIDGGSWRVGWLLSHLRDPIFPLKFAGAEQELELISSYTKAVEELEKRTKRPTPGAGGNEK
jgi:hypothetical protein